MNQPELPAWVALPLIGVGALIAGYLTFIATYNVTKGIQAHRARRKDTP